MVSRIVMICGRWGCRLYLLSINPGEFYQEVIISEKNTEVK